MHGRTNIFFPAYFHIFLSFVVVIIFVELQRALNYRITHLGRSYSANVLCSVLYSANECLPFITT